VKGGVMMLNILEDANVKFSDVELTYLDSEQRKLFRDRFNTSNCPRAYAVTEDEIIFEMNKDAFASFEYYAGMEYERKHIELKIETRIDVLVVYSNESSRAFDIIAMIDPEALNYDEDE
jgi:uncharacterized membrane protein